jgi:hypothetical protein
VGKEDLGKASGGVCKLVGKYGVPVGAFGDVLVCKFSAFVRRHIDAFFFFGKALEQTMLVSVILVVVGIEAKGISRCPRLYVSDTHYQCMGLHTIHSTIPREWTCKKCRERQLSSL